MLGNLQVQGSQALQLRLHRLQRRHHLHLRQSPIRRRSLKPSLRLTQVQYYLHHNQNNMPKVKGNVESREQEVLVQKTRRRYHAISTSSRNHANMGKIVLTVMIRKSSTPARMEKAKVEERLQEAHLRPTRRRRLTNRVGIGRKGIVVLETSAISDMILTCLRQHPMLMRNRQRRTQLQHYFMVMTVTLKSRSLRSLPPNLPGRSSSGQT